MSAKPAKMIIHIDGVQGSGKSYILSKLKNVECVDTDDIMEKVVEIIESSQKTNKKIPRTPAQAKIIEKRLMDEYIDANDKIVFAGMTAIVPSPTHKFFVKIDDFTAVYKRLLLRELDKIITHREKIKRYIDKENDPRRMDLQWVSKLSVKFPVDYKEFLDDYKERLKSAKKKKYTPKTQDQIISIINEL